MKQILPRTAAFFSRFRLLTFAAFAVFTVLALQPRAANAQQLTAEQWTQVHTTTVAAMNELYNLRFNEAEAKCNEVVKLAPQDPRGHFFKAMTYYYRNLVSKEKGDFEKFLSASSRAIQVCEAILKNNPTDSRTMFYMGGLQGYRGLLYVNNDDLTKAMWEGKKGLDKLNEAVALDPTNVDAQMGVGLFNYLISQAPAFIKPALKLAGLNGDRVAGLKLLENVAAKGTYARYEAMFWLSNFYSGRLEQQYERAGYHYGNLITQFPANTFYQNLYGNLLLNRLRKADKAIAQFQTIVSKITSNAPNGSPTTPASRSSLTLAELQLGVAQTYKNNFSEAIAWCQKAIATGSVQSGDSGYVRAARYYAGICHEIQGNRAAALPFYQQSLGEPESAKRLKTAITPHEVLQIKQQYLFNAGDYNASATLGEQLLASSGVAASIRAESLYFLGRAAHEQGNYAKAEERLVQCVGISAESEEALPPNSRYHLGLAQVKLGKKAEAKSSFEAAMSFDKYPNAEYTKKIIQKELWRLKNS